MAEPKLIKVRLTNQGEDIETPWAHDLGPAPNAAAGARTVKLVNVPFMHAKPTWGDTIVVTPAADAFPTWDRGGVKWNEISSRIVEDGGRWAMILDYRPHDDVTAADAFSALARVCDVERIVCEGAWAPRDADPGRAYLAVPKDTVVGAVIDRLDGAGLPMHIILVHPELKRPRAKTAVGVTPAQPRKPARPKPAPVTKPASAKIAAKPAPAKIAAKAAPAKTVMKPAAKRATKSAPTKALPAKAGRAKAKALPARKPTKSPAKKR